MRSYKTSLALLILVMVLVGVTACQSPPSQNEGPQGVAVYSGAVYFPPGGDQMVVASGGEIEVQDGGTLDVQGDTTLANLTVTGGVTGTNVLVTGDQTIAGVKTFSTAIAVGAVTGPSTLTGPTAVATATPALAVNNLGAGNVAFEVRDSATPVFQVLNGGAVAAGAVSSKAPVLAKISDYPATTADTGALIKSSGTLTITLPAAVAGLNYCLVNYDGGDLTIAFADATDVALNEVNSPGDRVTNTTAYDNICLAAVDATNWVTLSSIGTWADGN